MSYRPHGREDVDESRTINFGDGLAVTMAHDCVSQKFALFVKALDLFQMP